MTPNNTGIMRHCVNTSLQWSLLWVSSPASRSRASRFAPFPIPSPVHQPIVWQQLVANPSSVEILHNVTESKQRTPEAASFLSPAPASLRVYEQEARGNEPDDDERGQGKDDREHGVLRQGHAPPGRSAGSHQCLRSAPARGPPLRRARAARRARGRAGRGLELAQQLWELGVCVPNARFRIALDLGFDRAPHGAREPTLAWREERRRVWDAGMSRRETKFNAFTSDDSR